jgi:hypothetical protein
LNKSRYSTLIIFSAIGIILSIITTTIIYILHIIYPKTVSPIDIVSSLAAPITLLTGLWVGHGVSSNNLTIDNKKMEEILNKVISQSKTTEEERVRDNFINISNISFYFYNKEQIENLYKTYFQGATLDSLISETSGDQKGEIKGKTNFIEATIGRSNARKLTSTYKFDEMTIEGMFIQYQREMIRTNQVQLIPDEINYNRKELNDFDNAIQNIQQNYNLSLNQEEIEDRRNQLRIKSVQNVLTSLENLSGWVLIEGKFTIELEDQNYKCTYVHPINNHLPTQSPLITISMTITPQALKENINNHFTKSINMEIPLKVYAKVWHSINRNKNIWDIYIDPLAIY